MVNQRDVLPDKTLVMETKSIIIKQQNEAALLLKPKSIDEKLSEQTGGPIT